MPKRKHRGVCPLCERTATLTRDHVPPVGIFLDPKPDNLITVKTCADCNSSTKLDDEYFRIMVAAAIDPGPAQSRLWDQKIKGSTLLRSPGLGAALRRGQWRTILLTTQVPVTIGNS